MCRAWAFGARPAGSCMHANSSATDHMLGIGNVIKSTVIKYHEAGDRCEVNVPLCSMVANMKSGARAPSDRRHAGRSPPCRIGSATHAARAPVAAAATTAAWRRAAAAARWTVTWRAARCSSGRRPARRPATRRACVARCAAGVSLGANATACVDAVVTLTFNRQSDCVLTG